MTNYRSNLKKNKIEDLTFNELYYSQLKHDDEDRRVQYKLNTPTSLFGNATQPIVVPGVHDIKATLDNSMKEHERIFTVNVTANKQNLETSFISNLLFIIQIPALKMIHGDTEYTSESYWGYVNNINRNVFKSITYQINDDSICSQNTNEILTLKDLMSHGTENDIESYNDSKKSVQNLVKPGMVLPALDTHYYSKISAHKLCYATSFPIGMGYKSNNLNFKIVVNLNDIKELFFINTIRNPENLKVPCLNDIVKVSNNMKFTIEDINIKLYVQHFTTPENFMKHLDNTYDYYHVNFSCLVKSLDVKISEPTDTMRVNLSLGNENYKAFYFSVINCSYEKSLSKEHYGNMILNRTLDSSLVKKSIPMISSIAITDQSTTTWTYTNHNLYILSPNTFKINKNLQNEVAIITYCCDFNINSGNRKFSNPNTELTFDIMFNELLYQSMDSTEPLNEFNEPITINKINPVTNEISIVPFPQKYKLNIYAVTESSIVFQDSAFLKFRK